MPDLRPLSYDIVLFINPRLRNPYHHTTLRPLVYNVIRFKSGLAKTSLSGTIKDKDGIGVQRSYSIFNAGQLITAIFRGESASDGTFSCEVNGNQNDEFVIIALGDRLAGEDCPIASRIKGQAV